MVMASCCGSVLYGAEKSREEGRRGEEGQTLRLARHNPNNPNTTLTRYGIFFFFEPALPSVVRPSAFAPRRLLSAVLVPAPCPTQTKTHNHNPTHVRAPCPASPPSTPYSRERPRTSQRPKSYARLDQSRATCPYSKSCSEVECQSRGSTSLTERCAFFFFSLSRSRC